MKISAKSPCRVDLAGGTLDIWPLYLYHPGAISGINNWGAGSRAAAAVEREGAEVLPVRIAPRGVRVRVSA